MSKHSARIQASPKTAPALPTAVAPASRRLSRAGTPGTPGFGLLRWEGILPSQRCLANIGGRDRFLPFAESHPICVRACLQACRNWFFINSRLGAEVLVVRLLQQSP